MPFVWEVLEGPGDDERPLFFSLSGGGSRSRSLAVSSPSITSSILLDGYVDPVPPLPTLSPTSPKVASSSSSCSGLLGVLNAGVGKVHVPISEIRLFPCAHKSCNRLAAQDFEACCKPCSTSSGVIHSGRCISRENFVTLALEHMR